MKSLISPIGLAAMALSCAVLVPRTVSGSQQIPTSQIPDRLPEWARTRQDPDYPVTEFLIGLGIAGLEGAPTEAIAKAAANSRADIAKQIRSRVEQVLRDSIREDRLAGGISISRISGNLTIDTRETTDLELEGVEVARQWIGSRNVYVLSVLNRADAAARAEARIVQLEAEIESDLREIEASLSVDPLGAMGRLARTAERATDLAMQYEILSGVTRTLRLPPEWLGLVTDLRERVHAGVRAAVVIQESRDGLVPRTPTSYAAIESFLVELGWTIRKLDPEVWDSEPRRSQVVARLREDGLRYLVLVDAEAKLTESVRAGASIMHFARAGGKLELLDLVDNGVLHRVDYPFPSETKVARRDPEAARRSAIERLFGLMLNDLVVYLQGEMLAGESSR